MIGKLILNILVSAISAYAVYDYAPLWWFGEPVQNLGATITTINGTDTISGSRATINTNFSNLNTAKLETSDYYGTTTHANISSLPSLVSVGTLTTGTWNGTAIGVAYNGTGTTTPGRYLVMLGDGSYGLAVASTTGTSGQVFTSNGAGSYPSWGSGTVDQTISYNWTGSYFGVKNLEASSTVANPIKLNTVSYDFPSTAAASSTFAAINSTGGIRFTRISTMIAAPEDTAFKGSATTTVYATTLPASFLRVGDVIRVTGMATSSSGAGDFFGHSFSVGGVATTTCGHKATVTAGTPTATSTFTFIARVSGSTRIDLKCVETTSSPTGFTPLSWNSHFMSTNIDASSVAETATISNSLPLIFENRTDTGSLVSASTYGVVIEYLTKNSSI